MRKEQQIVQQEDLFESGKAHRNAFFGSGSPPHSGPPQGNIFPGYGSGGGYGGHSDGGGNLPVPYGGGQQQNSSMFGNLPIKDIKAFVDRMGGVEGIMNTVNKMNALMKNVQQMAPMIKLLAGSFLNKNTADDEVGHTTRTTKRRTNSRKRTSRQGHRTRRPTGNRPRKRKSTSHRPRTSRPQRRR